MSHSLKLHLIFALILTFSLFFNIQNSLAANSRIFVVANVDNEVITNLDLKNRYRFFVRTSNIQVATKSQRLFILNLLIEKLVGEKLQTKNAEKLKIEVLDEEVTNAIKSIARSQGQSLSLLKEMFAGREISYSQYFNQIKSQLLFKKIVRKKIAPRINITQADIEEMLELQNLDSKKMNLNLAEIFIHFKNKEEEEESLSLAQKIVEEVRHEGNFANIARQFSESSSKDLDGEIGWVEISSLNPKISKAIKNLNKNQISDPIKTNKGYYIFKILDKKMVRNLEKNEEDKIRDIIFNEKLQSAAKKYAENLKKSAYVRIYEDKLRLVR